MRSGRKNLEQLEEEIRGSAYQVLLGTLQRQNLFLRRFRTWVDVAAFMRTRSSWDPLQDKVLRPTLTAHGKDQDPRWRWVLLLIFWPSLERIHSWKRHWDKDLDALWSNVYWAFHETICRIDVRKRSDKLTQRIINGTVHRLHDIYRRDWDRYGTEVTTDPQEDAALFGSVEGVDLVGIDLRRAQQQEIQRLRGHLHAGRISEADFFLLVGTRVYGSSLADYARDSGLGYQAAKKRRLRAEAAIRWFEKKRGDF